MHLPSIPRKWSGLSSRIALLLGLGALSAAGAKADTGEVRSGHEPTPLPQHSVKSFGDLLIWSEGERIYIAEPGKEARELPLGNTPEACRLRLLLEQEGATAAAPHMLRDRIVLVGGGGAGFHWAPVPRPDARDKTNGAAARTSENPPSPNPPTPVGQIGTEAKPSPGGGDGRK
jgi:hypothetical protein